MAIGCSESRQKDKPVMVQVPLDQQVAEQAAYASIGKLKLSDYGFFKAPLAALDPTENVMPYDLNTPLFSDYARKKRFIYIPEGGIIDFSDQEVLGFPEGTVLIKNFYYEPDQANLEATKIIETRLLIHQSGEWKSLPYIWNADQTEAFLEITGGSLAVDLKNKGVIQYGIPTMTECKSCHDRGGAMTPIGPTVRQLNRLFDYPDGQANQLQRMVNRGWLELPQGRTLEKLAVWDDPLSGTLEHRARAYLDINCAHCHNDAGPAKNSGLNLSIYEGDPYRMGLNKRPVAAGRGSADLQYGIEAGEPDKSILVHRMTINDPGTRMPEIGRSIAHQEGIELIRQWIEEMEI